MKKPTCETCDYFLLIYEMSKSGECLKNAPVIVDHMKPTSFPVTQSHKWCGEHQDFKKWQDEKEG